MSRFAFCLVVAVAALGALSAQVAFAEEVKSEGTIAKIEGNQVTIKAEDAQHEVMLGPSSRITLDGRAATQRDLKVGQKVKCTADKEGDKLTCRLLEVTSGG
jgi:ABC-type enterochelin transport system substrate-binding protein